MKNLVIVESPAKAKTINKYLGKDFIVKSSIGHIRDLSPINNKEKLKRSEKEKIFDRMGLNPENNWKANYAILEDKKKVIKELKELAKKSDVIYLATDLDREGEAIAWHLKEELGKNKVYKRVIFNEITKSAISQAFANPQNLNMNRVNAQQTRRFLDITVGYMLSPLLWKKIARNLSAGRVQSVAVKLIVQREKEVRLFKPEEYWSIDIDLKHEKSNINAELIKYKNQNIKIKNEKQTNDIKNNLKNQKYYIKKIEQKSTITKPNPPFTTSTMQQVASSNLGFSVKKTMILAQKLYEAGLITYMRTDSTNISKDFLDSIREHILQEFGSNYLPKNSKIYTNKENSQEAHEAIRPTDIKIDKTLSLENDAQKLYSLIYRRTLASQMNNAQYEITNIFIQSCDYTFLAKGKIIKFDGFTRVINKKIEDQNLPNNIKENDELILKNNEDIHAIQHFTKGPSRYSESTLVKTLEEKEIGRPSTYASIISTIQDRGYVFIENKKLHPNKIGEIVTSRLESSFQDLMNYDFTAKLEKKLDKIENEGVDYIQVLNEFYKTFQNNLHQAIHFMSDNNQIETQIKCPICKTRNMNIRTASTGRFLGCSGYNLPIKERCKGTINLIANNKILDINEDALTKKENEENNKISQILLNKKQCKLCNSIMDSYIIDNKRQINICSNNPDCSGFIIEEGEFQTDTYAGPIVKCDKCNEDMKLKNGRFGKFFACTECENTRKLLKNGQVAPPKITPIKTNIKCSKVDDYFVLRSYGSSLFLAASKFPKFRETRSPYIYELIPFKEQLENKYHYILQAPLKDDKNNDTILSTDRKTGKIFIKTNIKNNQWRAEFINNQWISKVNEK